MENLTALKIISPQIPVKTKSVLLVEDHLHRMSSFSPYLESEHYLVFQRYHNDNIIGAILETQPDIIVINISDSDMSASEHCKAFREKFAGPIVVLTTNANEHEQIASFNAGVDDFLVKPISPRILKVRLDALFRRQPISQAEPKNLKVQVGDITLYPMTQKCQVNGKGMHLSAFEFKLLNLLLTNVGKIMSRDLIYNHLLGREYNGEERTVDVRVSKLRDKLTNLGARKAKIETVWGRGYIINEVIN